MRISRSPAGIQFTGCRYKQPSRMRASRLESWEVLHVGNARLRVGESRSRDQTWGNETARKAAPRHHPCKLGMRRPTVLIPCQKLMGAVSSTIRGPAHSAVCTALILSKDDVPT